jgi:hypothetical protein
MIFSWKQLNEEHVKFKKERYEQLMQTKKGTISDCPLQMLKLAYRAFFHVNVSSKSVLSVPCTIQYFTLMVLVAGSYLLIPVASRRAALPFPEG